MATIIRIKRSDVTGNPSDLAAGELAYSGLTDGGYLFNGGDRLYIGMGTETSGNAANHFVIGGKFFTDMLDHNKGTLTASSALIADANSKIDIINVGNVTVTGSTSTISTTNSNGNLYITPNGTGLINLYNAYTLPSSAGTAGYVLTTNGSGTASWQAASSTLSVSGDSGSNDSISLLTQTLNIAGTSAQGITTTTNGNQTITISASDATSSQKGVATFNTSGFVVTTGDVALKSNVVQSINTDSGSATPTVNAFKIAGDTNSGVNTAGTGSQVAISVSDATSGQKGVSKFSAAYFTVTSGDVAINNATTTTKGIASFSSSYFNVSSGAVSIVDATSSIKGAASFDSVNFTVSSGNVQANAIYLGTTELNLGDISGSNLQILGLSQITVGNLELQNNTLSTTDSNGNLILDPNGTGLVSIANAFTLPRVAGTAGYVLTTDGSGATSWQASSSALTIADDASTTESIALLTETLAIKGDGPTGAISTVATSNTLTISARDASTTQKGVASFASTTFNVTSGAVDVKSGGISNTQLANHKVTVGTTDIDLGSSSTTLAGLTDVTIANIEIATNNITATGDLNLIATGGHVKVQNTWSLPDSAGTNGYVLTTDGTSAATWQQISTTLNLAGDTGTDSFDLIHDTLTFDGDAAQGVSTAVSNGSTVAITVADASTTSKGVASFQSVDFSVTTGAVSLADSVVKSVSGDTGSATPSTHAFTIAGTTAQGITTSATGSTVTITASDATSSQKGVAKFNSGNFTVTSGTVTSNKFTLGTTDVNLGNTGGSAILDIAGLDSLQTGNIKIWNSNTIEATNANGDITLKPNGTGHISASNALVRDVAMPLLDYDAATKKYVDTVAQGLHVHNTVDAATNDTLANLTSGSVTYNNGTAGVGATLTLTNPLTTLDSYSLSNDDRILVKNEGDSGGAGSHANGVYVRTSSTVLTRASDFNTPPYISGGDFVFIVSGTTYGDTGWVQTEKLTAIGTGHPILFTQFSGAGTYSAGSGLGLSGTIFYVDVNSSTGGIEISSNQIQLQSTVAGAGLTYTNGVIDVVGTSNRITVNADSIDISSSYVGQTSITTVSNTTGITTGTWKADVIDATYGGTGFSSYSTNDLLVGDPSNSKLKKLHMGTAGQVLQVDPTGSFLEYADLDGGTF